MQISFKEKGCHGKPWAAVKKIKIDLDCREVLLATEVNFTNPRRGIMSSRFLGYEPYAGDLLSRINGAIISDRAGKSTPYALFNLLSTGKQFIRPTEVVFEGQVIGEHAKQNDINVNCVREKHLSSVRTAGKDENIQLPPIQDMTVDYAMNWIDDDEWVLITPTNVRVRKRELQKNLRSTIKK